MKTTTLPSKHSINLSSCWFALLIPLAFACFAVAPLIYAQCPQICDSGNGNTSFGSQALPGDTGFNNTAIGDSVLFSNTGGDYNTATGAGALKANTTGTENTAIGISALLFNTTGYTNTATGAQALAFNTTGNLNTADGFQALFKNSTGSNNIGVGFGAGSNLTTGRNNIDIGNAGAQGESNKIRIGTNGTHTNTFIAGISGVTVANGVGVIINPQGQLGTIVSSERFKDVVKPMDKASEAVLALKPVTFRYKQELDPEGIPQFGLVAEEVEKVNPDLVARDDQGKPYTVRYEAVNAMLLNEFLKEHRKVEELEQQIEKLTAGLQRVSAQLAAASPSVEGLELSKASPQTVLNDQ